MTTSRPEHAEYATLRQDTAGTGRSPGHLLVADDDPVVQAVTERLLQSAGYTAEAVADGRAVLAALKGGNFDLVIMDCSMPVMDGFEAARAIRNDKSGQIDVEIPIIALTALALDDDPERCLEAGMNEFVAKPVDRERLLAAIERSLLSERSPTARTRLEDGPGQGFGDAGFMDGLIDRFLQRLPAVQKEIQAALEHDDRAELQRLAHRLRGAADLLNARSLSARAAKLEHLARTGPAGGIRDAASRLLDEMGKVSMIECE